MKKKAEISRPLIKRTIDELIGWRDYCDEFGDLEGRVRIQSVISEICAELEQGLHEVDAS